MNIINENIQILPEELIDKIIENCDTSSLFNLKKTSKLLNKLTKNYLDRIQIKEYKTDIFKLELSFELNSLTNKELNKIINSNNNIYDYIEVVKIDIVNLSIDDKLIVYNIIHYDINKIKIIFNKFLKDHNIYNILMNIKNKYYELLINISNQQETEIYNIVNQNKRGIFSSMGDNEEYNLILNKLKNNISCNNNKEFKINMIWINMQNIIRVRSIQKKKFSINIKLDLTYDLNLK